MTPRAPRRAARLWATTATALVPLLVVTSLPACATLAYRPSVRTAPAESQQATQSPEWSRVEAVRVGTRIRVQLHEASPDGRTLTGRFHAATTDTLTLTLADGQTRTLLEKQAVHTVHIRRPIIERYMGWIPFVGVMALTTYLLREGKHDLTLLGRIMFGAIFGVPASLPGFRQGMQRIYEALPEQAQLIAQVDVSFTDGAVVPRNEAVIVSVAHASRAGLPPNEPIGLTVCLSSHAARCTGSWAVFKRRAGTMVSPVTMTLELGDETVPLDTPMSVYVHVVLTRGSSWRPSPDQAVPQLGDPGILDVETVTRRITVVDQ